MEVDRNQIRARERSDASSPRRHSQIDTAQSAAPAPRRLARPAHVKTGSQKGLQGRVGEVNEREHKTRVTTGLASGK